MWQSVKNQINLASPISEPFLAWRSSSIPQVWGMWGVCDKIEITRLRDNSCPPLFNPSSYPRYLYETKNLWRISIWYSFAGIKVSPIAEADSIFNKSEPDICLIQTATSLADLMPHLELCAKHGVNVLTLGESIYYPWLVYEHRTALHIENMCF